MPSKPELLPRISRLIRGRRQIFLVVERAQQTKVHNKSLRRSFLWQTSIFI